MPDEFGNDLKTASGAISQSTFKGFEAAIFDLDGTLVDTAPDLAAALNACLAEDGHAPFAVNEMRGLVGRGAGALLEKGYRLREGVAPTPERLAILRARFLEIYGAQICVHSTPFPGVEKALDDLVNAGVRCGVCTNKPHDMAVKLLDALGWGGRFRAVLGGEAATQKKPSAIHIQETLSAMGDARAQAFFVGDSEVDHAAAKAANMPLILVRFGYSNVPISDLAGAVILEDYSQLSAAVAAL